MKYAYALLALAAAVTAAPTANPEAQPEAQPEADAAPTDTGYGKYANYGMPPWNVILLQPLTLPRLLPTTRRWLRKVCQLRKVRSSQARG
jgi:hypothetical protein